MNGLCRVCRAAHARSGRASTDAADTAAAVRSFSAVSLHVYTRRYGKHDDRAGHPRAGLSRAQSTLQNTLRDAEKLAETKLHPSFDPTELVGREISELKENIKKQLGSNHPGLGKIATYYFTAQGKHLRPMLVLLMSLATNHVRTMTASHSRQSDPFQTADQRKAVDTPLSPSWVLEDPNPEAVPPQSPWQEILTRSTETAELTSFSDQAIAILPTQRRLAEITEMIHVASLLHDDVIDSSALRRGAASAPSAFGNKLAILAGDFLLGRASVALARLRNVEVVELLATVIANLVEGEVMQMDNIKRAEEGVLRDHLSGQSRSAATLRFTKETFDRYMRKTYLKTASLMAKSCRATTLLAGRPDSRTVHDNALADLAYNYGRHVGLAFQLIDDLLDFTASSDSLFAVGKPAANSDLKLGLATAPVLFAWEEHGEAMGGLLRRDFGEPGDVEKARELVSNSQGLERTRLLAKNHAQMAVEQMLRLPPTLSRQALIDLANGISSRQL